MWLPKELTPKLKSYFFFSNVLRHTGVGLQALKFATFRWANVLEINVVIVINEK